MSRFGIEQHSRRLRSATEVAKPKGRELSNTKSVPRATSVVLPDNTAKRAPLPTQRSVLANIARVQTCLLLPLDPKNERKLQAEATQLTTGSH